MAESDAEERSRQPLHFTDKTLDIIKRGPTVVEAVHVGEPTLDDPEAHARAGHYQAKTATMFSDAVNAGRPPAPAAAVTPTGAQRAAAQRSALHGSAADAGARRRAPA